MKKFRTVGIGLLIVGLLISGCGNKAVSSEDGLQTIKVGEVTHSVL